VEKWVKYPALCLGIEPDSVRTVSRRDSVLDCRNQIVIETIGFFLDPLKPRNSAMMIGGFC
jgi:hypothetical protein